MSSKFTPRIEHNPGRSTGLSMNDLARIGVEMYHPYNRYVRMYEQKLGQMSLLEVVPPAPEVPEE